MIITIDGPAASGKSSVARKLAKHLEMYYLNTGLLYRAIAYVFHEKLSQPITELSDLSAQDLSFIANIQYGYHQGRPHVSYDGEEITEFLHDAVLDQVASTVSANEQVRAALLFLQRDIAKKHDIVADGRDCGSVIFPQADFKFYLDADLAIRAQRLLDDPERQHRFANEQEAMDALAARDERDFTREVAPLQMPQGAIRIDNSSLTIDETVAAMLDHIQSH